MRSLLVIPSFGQNTLSKLVNFSSWPFTFLTWVLSVGFNSVFRGPFTLGVTILSSISSTIFSVGVSSSRITFLALLSSRIPSNEGCRIIPSLVNSAKLTSQTSSGLSHVTVACGGFGLKREGLLTSGSSEKGALLITSGLNSFIISF